jgi:anti-sigma factor RsiW
MIDCPNVEMRDRLPDLANDTLAAAERDLVLAHLAHCAACTAEIEILRTTRLILRQSTPKVNVASIVLALPSYGSRAERAAVAPRRGWANSWRVAAAVTFLAAGIGSYEVLRKDSGIRPVDTMALASADSIVGFGLTGALADLSDAELTALASDIDDIEALPSTEVETLGSAVSVPAILPDSIVQDLEDQ